MYLHNNVFDNSKYRKKRKQFKNKIEIVNIGSGPSYFDIDMSDFTDNYLSLAKWTQSLAFDLCMLKAYEDLLNENCIILVVITWPLSFGKYYRTKKEEQDRDRQYIHHMKYQDEFSLSNLQYTLERIFYVHSFPRKIYHMIKRVLRKEHQIILEDEMTMQDLIEVWYRYIHLTNLQDAKQADEQRDGIEKKTRDLANIIDYCLSKKYRPILVIPPIGKELRENISKEFLDEFLYKNIQKANQGRLELFDFSSDYRFDDENLFRKNNLFLNEKGRKHFSNILWNIVDEKGKEEIIC